MFRLMLRILAFAINVPALKPEAALQKCVEYSEKVFDCRTQAVQIRTVDL